MKGITGAVLNNLFLMKTKGMFLCIIVAFGAMAFYLITDNDISRQVSILVFLLLVPLTTLNSSNVAFDSKWNRIEKLWGVRPFTMIASRYIIYATISLALSATWVLSPFHDGNMQNIADFVTLVLFTGALYYPIMHLLNSDHNMGIIIIMISASVGWLLLERIATLLDHTWADGFSFVLLGAVCAVYLVSLVLSVVFSEVHRGRGA